MVRTSRASRNTTGTFRKRRGISRMLSPSSSCPAWKSNTRFPMPSGTPSPSMEASTRAWAFPRFRAVSPASPRDANTRIRSFLSRCSSAHFSGRDFLPPSALHLATV